MEKWMLWIVAMAMLSGNGREAKGPAAHSPAVPAGQTAPGTRLEFEVASVKQNNSDLPKRPYSNFSMGPDDIYSSNGGLFIARNWPFVYYLQFAYKITAGQYLALTRRLPDWTKIDRFDIEARAEGDPTKDQMRLMVQSLLAERFKLAIHHEAQQVPVFALVLAKQGKTGPKLLPHPASDTTCSNAPLTIPGPGSAQLPQPTAAAGFPVTCGGLASLPSSTPGRIAWGYRNVTMALIVGQMPMFGLLDRPVIDQTGLAGNYDFRIEFAPEAPGFDTSGPTFLEALREQVGLKLNPQKGPVDVIIVDHVEHPSEN